MTETSHRIADPLLAAIAAGVQTIDLAQPLANGMPCSPNHPGFRMVLARRHGDMVREDGGSAASEMIMTGGHVGTHIDALAHVSQDGFLYDGVDCMAAQTGGAFSVHGVDTIAPRICHGILLDIAKLHGVQHLPGGHGITAEELAEAAERAGVRPQPGGVCLVNTGWGTLWTQPQRYLGFESGVPGVTPDAARWLARHEVAAAGADTSAFEQVHPGRGHATLPVHRILLVDNGIHIMEHLRLTDLADRGIAEFAFVLAPLNIVGATGSPIRPLAIVSSGR
ncbi:cyclase family protein [Nocardia terpenica]|uniref:cyclase family protein n=1 Tax=Nocardia terpenica TaxID=455432 RepID=UPI0018944F9F|nr:cyclase family protein [Nocardia terpenica]MBF6063736.1 cyclase family protein [Nocardia terpenica]MBF6107112.1 cyclase family protein [Nocardia terpenica]MBF6114285.1 cyclase family protein [Nocardia terpenica]MBF6121628.1 cyclase family protein [Nocardia terpenica]MBF6154043.1 cyclase family protein [Nocardia terpenica]